MYKNSRIIQLGQKPLVSRQDAASLKRYIDSCVTKAAELLGYDFSHVGLECTVGRQYYHARGSTVAGSAAAYVYSKDTGTKLEPVDITVSLLSSSDFSKRPIWEEIERTVFHELHHVHRDDVHKHGYGRTIGEALISEGEAMNFQEEATKTLLIYDGLFENRVFIDFAQKTSQQLDVSFENCKDHVFSTYDTINKGAYFGHELGHRITSVWNMVNEKRPFDNVGIYAKDVLNWWLENDPILVPLFNAKRPFAKRKTESEFAPLFSLNCL